MQWASTKSYVCVCQQACYEKLCLKCKHDIQISFIVFVDLERQEAPQHSPNLVMQTFK